MKTDPRILLKGLSDALGELVGYEDNRFLESSKATIIAGAL